MTHNTERPIEIIGGTIPRTVFDDFLVTSVMIDDNTEEVVSITVVVDSLVSALDIHENDDYGYRKCLGMQIAHYYVSGYSEPYIDSHSPIPQMVLHLCEGVYTYD